MLKKDGCKSRFCPECGPLLGYRLRESMRREAAAFKKPMLLSLTIDRHGTTTGNGFSDPKAAYDYVREGRYIARLMRQLGIRLWICVLECQSKTGEGWPHWHLLVDAVDLPHGRLPKKLLERMWKLWRDTWMIGGLDVEAVKFNDRNHAIFYISKYLIKQPERGWPEWILDARHVRLVSCSRALNALVGDGDGRAKKDEVGEDAEKPERKRRSTAERVSRCGMATKVLEESVDHETGEVSTRYVGEIPAKLADVMKAVKAEDSPVRIGVREIPMGSYTKRSVEVEGRDFAFEVFREWLEGNAVGVGRDAEIAERERKMRAKWRATKEVENSCLTQTENEV